MNIILVLVVVMTNMINYRRRGITTHCSFVVYLTMLSLAQIMLLLNYWMTLKNELDRRWKTGLCPNLRNYSSSCLECLRKT
jgi:heme/copper-type cytochrome/quinol oxidase subunit 4